MVDRPEEKWQTGQVWKSLTDAGLVEIQIEEFAAKLEKVKHVAIGHLGELLERQSGHREQESVAHSLGTLKQLETRLRTDRTQPRR